ncbi:DBF4-type zinc finger-containing protein 2 homolog [Thamnophis elegans]|uniref:DBF4-type zinc finger-containing protein 2 homolog n=1 Tax=Thamnophis elegans TaxID=35005 RepID=UPI0013771455|nr:DBF4-type zinc finger-containing protein 2 homolog [Thamnophis elegans]
MRGRYHGAPSRARLPLSLSSCLRGRRSSGAGQNSGLGGDERRAGEAAGQGALAPPAGGSPALAQVRTCLGAGSVTSRRAGSAGWQLCSARLPGSQRGSSRRRVRLPCLARAAACAARASRSPATPEPPRRVHAAAIPASAMARPLQDRSRAQPTATVPRSPTFPVGGTLALPPSVSRPPLALSPGLNCLYRCGRAPEPPGSARASLQPTASCAQEEAPTEPEQSARGLNGHLTRTPLSLEQAIGARLRHMGDSFHQDHEERERRPRGALLAHLYHLVFHLLGILDNLPARG